MMKMTSPVPVHMVEAGTATWQRIEECGKNEKVRGVSAMNRIVYGTELATPPTSMKPAHAQHGTAPEMPKRPRWSPAEQD